jgi:hypothetical protein
MGWCVAIALHLLILLAFLRLPLAPKPPEVAYFEVPAELLAMPPLPIYHGVPPGTGTLGGPRPKAPVPGAPGEGAGIPVVAPESIAPPHPPGWLILGPQEGDGRLWVAPRPAMPAAVADALYGNHKADDSTAVRRLRAMLDTINRMIDSAQLARRLPSWTVKNDSGKPMWGMDPSSIYIAGIKIPSVALALLGNLVPAGNYDEAQRARVLNDMRADLMEAAARTENLEDFRKYVRELRARKQAEHEKEEKEKKQKGDTTKVTP